MTRYDIVIVWVIVTLGGALPAEAARPLQVVTTTTDLAALVRAVGGEDVEVISLAKGPQDPHYVAAKPSFMARLNKADLLVYVGLQLEIGWLPLLIRGARNPAILPDRPGHLDASAGLTILERPTAEVDRGQGDIHPEGNPHYWLDPRNAVVVARSIAARLAELSPDRAATFQGRMAAFDAQMTRRITAWERQAAGLRGQRIGAYHKTFEYLAAWLGLTIAVYVEHKPGVPPAPRHVAQVIGRLRRERIPVVVAASSNAPAILAAVGERSGAATLVLPASVGAEDAVQTYVQLVDRLVTALVAAAGPTVGSK